METLNAWTFMMAGFLVAGIGAVGYMFWLTESWKPRTGERENRTPARIARMPWTSEKDAQT